MTVLPAPAATTEAIVDDLLIFGDYAIGEVSGPAVFPNRILAEAGLNTRRHL